MQVDEILNDVDKKEQEANQGILAYFLSEILPSLLIVILIISFILVHGKIQKDVEKECIVTYQEFNLIDCGRTVYALGHLHDMMTHYYGIISYRGEEYTVELNKTQFDHAYEFGSLMCRVYYHEESDSVYKIDVKNYEVYDVDAYISSYQSR